MLRQKREFSRRSFRSGYHTDRFHSRDAKGQAVCGIGGYLGASPIARSAVDEMLERLKRRGPDAQNRVLWNADFGPASDQVFNALATARLAIMDPRPEADQPMANDVGDIWISYNGEVYDWAAAAEELRGRGAVFRTHCATEFILRADEAG